jgi:hypothetical protein
MRREKDQKQQQHQQTEAELARLAQSYSELAASLGIPQVRLKKKKIIVPLFIVFSLFVTLSIGWMKACIPARWSISPEFLSARRISDEGLSCAKFMSLIQCISLIS